MLANHAHSSREKDAIVDMWDLNVYSYIFLVTSAILRHVQILQGPLSLVGHSLTSPMRNGKGYGGGEQSCRSCTSEQKRLKEK